MSDTPAPTIGPSRARGEEVARKWRKRRSRLRRRLRRTGDAALVALAIFAIWFGLTRAHSGGGSSTTTQATAAPGSYDARYPPMKDVALMGCKYWPRLYAGGVTMGVVNHTPTRWTYYVDVRFNDGATKYAETVLHSKPVKGFHTHTMGGFAFAPNHRPPQKLTCTIVSVKRVGT